MKTNFPNWGYIHYSLVTQIEKRYKIKYNYTFMRNQYNLLDNALKNNNDMASVAAELAANIGFQNSLLTKKLVSALKKIEEFQNIPNQFATIYNYKYNKFSYVQSNINEILNLDPKKFTINAFTGLDPINKHYHPEDILHFFRYALLAYFLFALLGHGLDISKTCITLKFRMKIPSYNQGKYFTVHKQTSLIENSIDLSDFRVKNHLDIWNITDNTNNFDFVTINFQMEGTNRVIELNEFSSMFNAKLLGFSTKEIVILYYWYKFNDRKKIASHLNSQLDSNEFTAKKITDFIYKLSTKIIKTYKENIIFHEIPIEEQKLISRKNALRYGLKLGLLSFDKTLIETILKSK